MPNPGNLTALSLVGIFGKVSKIIRGNLQVGDRYISRQAYYSTVTIPATIFDINHRYHDCQQDPTQ
ncbi:hypothetical protein ACSQ6I_27355 [Anabaena sp. WFMT]|uniref:hypothetical protein n=1 Tax=Anabaena sp. WFMT TaxID=3449730 RepID=UPI003F28918B